LQLPYVQNLLFGRFLQHLSHTTQFSIVHQRFQLRWLYHASLTGLTIKDPQAHTMLAVDQLALETNPLQLFTGMGITLKKVRIQGAQVHLHKEDAAGYNMHVLLQRLAEAAKPGSATQPAIPLVIESASLKDLVLSVDNHQTAPLKDALDTQHFTLHEIDAELANLKIHTSTLAADIYHLTGKYVDKSLWLDHFSTSLVISPDSITCQALQLRTEGSALEGSCTLIYDPSLPVSAFKDNVHITAHVKSAVVAAEELAVFVPYFKQKKTSYSFSGALEGKVSDLRIEDLQLGFGEQGSKFEGVLSIRGLPDVQEARFNMELQRGVLHTKDLFPYLDVKHYKQIEKLNFVKTKGRFYGKLADFIAKATFDTALGKVTTDLEVRTDLANQRTTYKGVIATSAFELGTWLDNATMQQLTMHGQIDGEGFSWATAHCQLEANIHQLGFNNYVYKNIHAHGQFSRACFQGKLTVDDPHLQLWADATINLSRGTESIAVAGVLDRVCLQALQLTDRCVTLRTRLSIAMQGLSLDNIKANAKLEQLCLDLEDREIRLDSLHIRTDRGALGHSLEVDSALLALKAEGSFSYASLASDFKQFIAGYQQNLMHAAAPPLPRYAIQPYTLAYQLYCKDINPLFYIFGIDAHVSPNTLLEGSFSQQEGATFSLRLAKATSLAFKKNRWDGTRMALSAHQSKDGRVVSAVVQLSSKEQQWGVSNATEDLSLAISWSNDQINFSSSLGQQGSHERIDVQGKALLLGNTLEIALTPAQGALADNQWYVHPDNRITLGKSWVRFQNFTFRKGQQQVSLLGTLSADPAEALHLKIKDCSLDNLHIFMSKPLTGVLHAAAVLQGPPGQLHHVATELTLEELTIDNLLVGDLHTKTSWNDIVKRLNMTCQLAYIQNQIAVIQGFYEPSKTTNSLQLTASFAHAPLAALAPFVANHLSQLSGVLDGTLYINGSPASPSVTGSASIIDAAVRVNYLNTLYQVRGALTFADQAINITTLCLSDDQQGKAELQGSIAHKGFRDFQIDATGDIENLKLLNTVAKDNTYFYGTGVLSGSVTASGPINNMVVCLKAKTNTGTNIFIPMHGVSNTVAQYDFIRFVDFEAQDKGKQTKQVAMKGFKLVLRLEITPDAYTELLLDTKTGGDVIKGRGKGNIQLEVDSAGALTMVGGFEFVTGEYNLSLYHVVNRTFKILAESKVTWHDSPPEKGVLDVRAMYEQQVALASLLGSLAVARAPKKYPVQVVVGLQGAFLSPEKSFTINFPEYPSALATVVNEFKQRAAQDKQYAETQALHLLLFQEVPTKEIAIDVVGRNFSSLISRQLSNFTSRLDDNLEVDLDVDLTAPGQEARERIHLDLAYNLVGGRLRVSRKGSIFGNTARAWSAAQFVGDWTVEYVLTRDGRLRAKLYNKHATNAAYTDTESTAEFYGGVSLLYTRAFNEWRELLPGSNRKRVAKKEVASNNEAQ
jgi:TamB, inner membrane protein subunit of TAM complex